MSQFCYGYVRIESANGGTSLVFSGVLVNNSGPTTNLTLTFTFSGQSNSYSTTAFALSTGDSAAFALPIDLSFAGSHSGSLEIYQGSTLVEATSFSSDDASANLGFQTVIIGHAMPDVTYPNLPSGVYPMAEEIA